MSSTWRNALLALVLILAALAAGTPNLDAYWIQGDEHRFIVNNSDVTDDGRPEPFWQRLLGLFTHVHEDLYQPIPIFTYALEWRLWGDQRIPFMRLTDVLLHGLNAVLWWQLLSMLLRPRAPCGAADTANRHEPLHNWLAWSLALLWALHPMLASAFGADMGRTHLLATAFALAFLRFHLLALGARPLMLAPALLLLLASMLSKPIVGLVAITLALDWAFGPGRAPWKYWRSVPVGLVCAGFAGLTLWTTRATGMMDDIGQALFGDPVTRSLLAAWLNLQHAIWPSGLAYRYLPDIHTGWAHPGVWMGLGSVLVSAAAFALAARKRSAPLVVIGLVWYWALVFPTLGIVSARVLAAQDRYVYMALMGLVLILASGLRPLLEFADLGKRPLARFTPALIALVAGLGLPAVRDAVDQTRGTLSRNEQMVRLYPGDPRAHEILANAIEFTTYHPIPGMTEAEIAALRDKAQAEVAKAGELADAGPQYFATPSAGAAMFRRLSFTALRLEDGPLAVAMAERAATQEPESDRTLTRLAHAYRLAGQMDKAAAAYAKLEKCPDQPPETAALRDTEFGDLLLHIFEQPTAAMERYKRALAGGFGPDRAMLGLARCEVLVGQGAAGFDLAQQYLRQHPSDIGALLTIALYHLRSHNFRESLDTYRAVLRVDRTNYEALRGFHELCGQFDVWREATLSWQAARAAQPDSPVFRAWFIWSAACSGEPEARQWADGLLESDPANRFAHYAVMLLDLRADNVCDALKHARLAAAGPSLPEAQETARAEKTLALMAERGQLPPTSALLRAALRAELGQVDGALELAESARLSPSEADCPELAALRERLRTLTSQPAKKSAEKRQIERWKLLTGEARSVYLVYKGVRQTAKRQTCNSLTANNLLPLAAAASDRANTHRLPHAFLCDSLMTGRPSRTVDLDSRQRSARAQPRTKTRSSTRFALGA